MCCVLLFTNGIWFQPTPPLQDIKPTVTYPNALFVFLVAVTIEGPPSCLPLQAFVFLVSPHSDRYWQWYDRHHITTSMNIQMDVCNQWITCETRSDPLYRYCFVPASEAGVLKHCRPNVASKYNALDISASRHFVSDCHKNFIPFLPNTA